MFARSALRTATPLSLGARRYASSSSGGGSGVSTAAYAVGGLAAVGGLWYAFSGTSKSEIKANAEQLAGKAPPKAFVGGDQGFLSLKLDKIEELTPNTKKFRFALPSAEQVSGLHVASAVVTKWKGEDMEKPVIRPYTPVSDEEERGFMDFIIKRYPEGPMTEHIHALKPGDTLDIKGPIPKYPMDENKHNHIAMVAGGTGITPMYQVIRGIFKNPNDQTKVSLVYGNVGEQDIILKKELDELANTYPRRFKVFYTLDNPPESWQFGKGFITKDLLKTILPEPKEDNIMVFVCGPPGLYKAVSGAKNSPQDQGELQGHLKDLGYSKEQVFKF